MPHNKPNTLLSSKSIRLKTPITNNPYKLPFLRQQKLAYLKAPQKLSPDNALESLPPELLQYIFSYLQDDPQTLAALAQTSRSVLSALMQPVRHDKTEHYYPFLQLLLEAESKAHLFAILTEHNVSSEDYLDLLGLKPEHITQISTLLPLAILSHQVGLLGQKKSLENTLKQRQDARVVNWTVLLNVFLICFSSAAIFLSFRKELPLMGIFLACYNMYRYLNSWDSMSTGAIWKAQDDVENKLKFFRHFKEALPGIKEITEEENTYCNQM